MAKKTQPATSVVRTDKLLELLETSGIMLQLLQDILADKKLTKSAAFILHEASVRRVVKIAELTGIVPESVIAERRAKRK